MFSLHLPLFLVPSRFHAASPPTTKYQGKYNLNIEYFSTPWWKWIRWLHECQQKCLREICGREVWQWPVLPFSFLSVSYFNLEIKNKFTSAHLYSQNKSSQLLAVMIYLAFFENLVLKMQNMTFYASTEQRRDFFHVLNSFVAPSLPPSITACRVIPTRVCNYAMKERKNLCFFEDIRQGQRPLDTKKKKERFLQTWHQMFFWSLHCRHGCIHAA